MRLAYVRAYSGIGKVWRDKEIYDYPNEKIELTAYKGDYGQAPWPYVISKHPEKALPYSGWLIWQA